jgi:hypothetical protein
MGTKEEEEEEKEITVVEEVDTKLKDLMDLLLPVTDHKHKEDTCHHPRNHCHLNMEVDTNPLNTQVDINLRLNTEVDMELPLKRMATMATGITTSLVMAMVTETGSCKPCLSALSCRHLLRVVSLRPGLHLSPVPNHPRSLHLSSAPNHLHSLHFNPAPNHRLHLHWNPLQNRRLNPAVNPAPNHHLRLHRSPPPDHRLRLHQSLPPNQSATPVLGLLLVITTKGE